MFILLIVVSLIPILVYPEFIFGGFRNEYLVKDYLLIFIFIAVLLSCFKNIFSKRGVIIKNTDKLCALYLSCSLFSWVINKGGVNPNALLMIFVYGALYIYISHLNIKNMKVDFIVGFWVFSLLLTGVYGVYQYFNNQQVVSGLGNRNFYGCFIVSGTPFLLLDILRRMKLRSFIFLIFDILLLLLNLFNLYNTRSRGAWVCLFICGVITWIFLSKRKIIPLVLSLLCLAVVFANANTRGFLSGQLSGDARPYIWKGTLNLIAENPLIGVGAGNFYKEYTKFRPHEYFLSPNATDITKNAHNELLEIWSETGSFGFFSLLALLVYLIYRVYLLAVSKKITPFVICLVISALSIFLHNLIDVSMRYTAMAAVFWVNLGLVSLFAEDGKPILIPYWVKLLKVPAYVLAVILSCALVWVFVIQSARAEVYFQKGVSARDKNEWDKALGYYKKALSTNHTYLTLLYYTAYAYDKAGNLPEAINTYKSIIKIDPYYALTRKNIAMCYLQSGGFDTALAEYSAHLMVNPYDPDCYLNMSYCFYKLNNESKAREFKLKAMKTYELVAIELIKHKQFFKAKGYLESAYNAGLRSSKIISLLAESYLNLGRKPDAVNILSEYLLKNPSDGGIRKILDELR